MVACCLSLFFCSISCTLDYLRSSWPRVGPSSPVHSVFMIASPGRRANPRHHIVNQLRSPPPPSPKMPSTALCADHSSWPRGEEVPNQGCFISWRGGREMRMSRVTCRELPASGAAGVMTKVGRDAHSRPVPLSLSRKHPIPCARRECTAPLRPLTAA